MQELQTPVSKESTTTTPPYARTSNPSEQGEHDSTLCTNFKPQWPRWAIDSTLCKNFKPKWARRAIDSTLHVCKHSSSDSQWFRHRHCEHLAIEGSPWSSPWARVTILHALLWVDCLVLYWLISYKYLNFWDRQFVSVYSLVWISVVSAVRG